MSFIALLKKANQQNNTQTSMDICQNERITKNIMKVVTNKHKNVKDDSQKLKACFFVEFFFQQK